MSPLNKDLMYTPLDALTAGVSPDGLKSRLAIKAMICFLLDTLPEPLSKDDILDVMCGHELANYFEVCDGLDRLIRLGNVIILDE
ncbi:MAG: DUF4364 family protein, partial [Oscillospiraceae bacterium]|nr:DUF4364 family protein [Oscillospiraceae bacterium]